MVTMSEVELKQLGVILGMVLLLIGVGLMISSIFGDWTLEVLPSKTLGIGVGGFLCILGTVIMLACLDVLDNVADVLSDLWKGFVDLIRR